MQIQLILSVIIFTAAVLFLSIKSFHIIKKNEKGVILRGEKLITTRGPGPVLILFPFHRMVRVNLKEECLETPFRVITTIDHVKTSVSCTECYRIVDAAKTVQQIDDYSEAILELTAAALRKSLPTKRIYDLLYRRERIDEEIWEELNRLTAPLGMEITDFEIKRVDILPEMQSRVARLVEDEEKRIKQMKLNGKKNNIFYWN